MKSKIVELDLNEIETVAGGVTYATLSASAYAEPMAATAAQVYRPATLNSYQAQNVDVAAFLAQFKR